MRQMALENSFVWTDFRLDFGRLNSTATPDYFSLWERDLHHHFIYFGWVYNCVECLDSHLLPCHVCNLLIGIYSLHMRLEDWHYKPKSENPQRGSNGLKDNDNHPHIINIQTHIHNPKQIQVKATSLMNPQKKKDHIINTTTKIPQWALKNIKSLT